MIEMIGVLLKCGVLVVEDNDSGVLVEEIKK